MQMRLTSGHTKSCGCYKYSEEYSKSQSQWPKDHPEEKLKQTKKYMQWRKDNPDKVAAANEKHKQWFKDNPDKVREQANNFSQWCKDNHDKVEEKTAKYLSWCDDNKDFLAEKGKRHSQWHIDNKDSFVESVRQWHRDNKDKDKERGVVHSQWCKDNRDKVRAAAQKHSEWYKNNPELARQQFDKCSQYCKDHPEAVKARSIKLSDYYKNNPDKVKELSKKISEWCKNNPHKVAERGNNYSQWCKDNPEKLVEMKANRSNTLKENPYIQESINLKLQEYYKDNLDKVVELHEKRIQHYMETTFDHSYLLQFEQFIHPDDYKFALNNIVRNIRTKCPLCGDYCSHNFSNVFCDRVRGLKPSRSTLPLCRSCRNNLSSSQYENEISDYVSTFYNGECITNSREIISPFELDLYYPEKKIAIEFNGDYWHSVIYKNSNYHYNKFINCYNNKITLVSVFESEWINRKDNIVLYLKDLFNDVRNKLSFDKEGYMNNNYPLPNLSFTPNYNEHVYNFRSNLVYTCGYTKLS